jgi:O-acetyl-ADP-ribose deacetylase
MKNEVHMAYAFHSGQILQLVKGDLTIETTDAIVNAANAYLQHGGGVAGVISRKGGPQIQADSDRWIEEHGPITHSKPAYTLGGNLPCRVVIHAVGPVWGEGSEDARLNDAVLGSLSLAEQLELESISFPAISTGIFGFPEQRAAGVILKSIEDYFKEKPHSIIQLVRVVLFEIRTLQIFLKESGRLFHEET